MYLKKVKLDAFITAPSTRPIIYGIFNNTISARVTDTLRIFQHDTLTRYRILFITSTSANL